MTKAEMILKLVMAPTIKHYTSFVDQYLKLLPESDMTEFQKILEMKVCDFFIFFFFLDHIMYVL
jgi:vacuolar protein sorting-associated protein 53